MAGRASFLTYAGSASLLAIATAQAQGPTATGRANLKGQQLHTDDGIKEVYWLSVLVRDGGAKHLPIQIFPARLNDAGLRELAKAHIGQSDLMGFWSNLKEEYDLFEKDHRLRDIHIAKDGRYEFVEESTRRNDP